MIKRRVIAIAQRKGGVGKTTTCVNLAACIAEICGVRPLVFDMDSQANTSIHCGHVDWTDDVDEPREDSPPVYRALVTRERLVDLAIDTGFGFDLIIGGTEIGAAENILASQVNGRMSLRSKIAALPDDRYPVVLIDTPPALGDLTLCALCAADTVIMPMNFDRLAFSGLRGLIGVVGALRQRENPELMIRAIFETESDPRSSHSATIRDRVEQLVPRVPFVESGALFDTADMLIRKDDNLKHACDAGRPVTCFGKRTNGADDYRKLTRLLIARGVLPPAIELPSFEAAQLPSLEAIELPSCPAAQLPSAGPV